VRLVVALILFAAAAALILSAPLSMNAAATTGRWRQVGGWMLCLLCMLLLHRLSRKLLLPLPEVATRSVLYLFLLFFALQRILALLPLPLPYLLREAVGALLVCLLAAVAFSRMEDLQPDAARLRWEHERFLAAAESSLDDFYIFDGVTDERGEVIDFRFSYINPNALRRLHATREELEGKILTEVRPFMSASGLIERYREVVRTGKPFLCEVYLDDERIQGTWLHVQVIKLGNGVAITSRDVTEHKQLIEHVSHLAHYDHLTGLANRALMRDRLQQAMHMASRHGEQVAVFMLDIDGFKQINDSLGHANGDAVLVIAAERLRGSVRDSDTVARFGGDEFVIIMPGFKNAADAARCGEQIVRNMLRPVYIRGNAVEITISLGMCLYPDDAADVDELLQHADAAMYAVKRTGRNGFRTFSGNLTPADCEQE
jgi:diguanylate cyclase (GGDEF)-like protein